MLWIGLQDWRPFVPIKNQLSVASCQLPEIARMRRPSPVYPPSTDHFLDSSTLRRTAAVMRYRRDVANRTHVEPRRCQGAYCRLASRTRAAHHDIHTAHAVIARLIGRVGGRLLRRKRRALARSPEAQRAGALPRHRVSCKVGDGDDGVVERRLHVHQAVGNVLAFLLLELLSRLALLVGCGSSCVSPCSMSSQSLSSYSLPCPCAAPCGCGHWCGCAGREPADCGDDDTHDTNRFR